MRAAAETAASPSTVAPPPWQRLLYAPALVDWILATYLTTVFVGLLGADPSPARSRYLGLAAGLLVAYAALVLWFRLRYEREAESRWTTSRLLAYHLLPIPTMLGIYFNLRSILPLINPATYDRALYRLDVLLFGVEPTIWLEPYTTPAVVEWFSFFYYSYFFFMASFVFVMVLTCGDERRLAEFGTGLLAVLAIGHFVYTLVPGYGPYAELSHEYRGPLVGGPAFHLVLEAVSAGGPLRDIFPSLHTAVPTYCTLFAWRHYRRVAPVATFFAANIVAATIVLRWHYAVDVLAGLVLAATCFWSAPRAVEAYQRRREALGLGWRRRW